MKKIEKFLVGIHEEIVRLCPPSDWQNYLDSLNREDKCHQVKKQGYQTTY